MPDGAKFCTNCGQKLYEETKTEQPVQPVVQQAPVQPMQQAPVQPTPVQPTPVQPIPQPQPQQAYYGQPVQPAQYAQGYYAQPQKKKSKAPLVVLLLCLIVFIVGGIGFFAYKWANSPDRKAIKAMEIEDYDTVNYLFDEITQKTADAIRDEYRSKFVDLEQQYENGDLEYLEVYSYAVTISEKVLKGDSVFEQLFDRLEKIHFSRSEFELAEEYFKKEMYSEALDCYLQVSVDDTLCYNKALDKIKACNDLMQGEIVGTWVYTVDVKPMMDGMEFWEDPINVDIYFEFESDGSGQLYVSNEAMMDAFREPATALMERELEKQGLPKAYLDVMLKLGGYDDVMDAIKDFAPDDAKDFFNGDDLQEYFIYNVDGNTLIINGYSTMEFELEGDYLTITSDNYNPFGLADLKIEAPYTLIRTYG